MSNTSDLEAASDRVEKSNVPTEAYFLSLTIANLRCFGSQQTLDLSDGNGKPSMWNILLGENGTGKTTLLWFLTEMAPRNSPDSSRVEGDFFSKPNSVYEWIIEKIDAEGFSAKENYLLKCFYLFNSGFVSESFLIVHKMLPEIKELPLVTSGFSTSAYGASRLMNDKSLADSARVDNTTRLLDPLTPLPNAEEWLVQADYAAKLDVENPRPKQRLEIIKQLLCELLPDVTDFKFSITPGTTMTPRVEAKTPYGWVRVRDLSLGYQTALAWIVDFASRMMDRYPDSENPFAEPAICLVDEIDLHTHPRWQKQLVQTLRRLFPKTQFIVTAHSPLIVQAAEDANIALLRREGDHVVIENDVDYIRDWRVDQILASDLFSNVGGESARSERLLAERTMLVEMGSERTAQDEARLLEIDAELDRLPVGTTAQDRDAMALIRDAAEWLKANPKA